MPLVMVFLRIAQSGDSATRQRLSEHLLPSSRDRDKPLGQGDSLPHRMLKLSTSSLHAELRELILTVYHELAGRDATQFVRHVGYGNAAGFLRAKGIPFTQEDPEEAHIDHSDFDPVTGQRWSSAPQPILAEMTAEDKEREAERLFVLFQRSVWSFDPFPLSISLSRTHTPLSNVQPGSSQPALSMLRTPWLGCSRPVSWRSFLMIVLNECSWKSNRRNISQIYYQDIKQDSCWT